jgi:succinate dehydrogenase / fumarate reductase flavoprotein subunit
MKEISSYKGLPVLQSKVVVLGTGAAGLNAADLLCQQGIRDLVIITESLMAGTSRNTGSDKQTYYKLSLAGSDSDSVRSMAEDLFNGRCVDGDIALAEAASSAPSFIRLAQLGVPFPVNRYGEYIGYKTDHDNHRRATSAGPYTSRYMTERLEDSVKSKGIEILDGKQAVRILVLEGKARGLVLIDRKTAELSIMLCSFIVLATGGPAGIYEMSVYPKSQFGSNGLAFEAGCLGRNLTEWQYGLASLNPRWNVSGSYMQVLPRFVSIDEEGKEHEFLLEYQGLDYGQMLLRTFLKGYQWPFDVRKVQHGSSIIDILCYLESEKGRRVYLDFMHNPGLRDIDFNALAEEAKLYLQNADATMQTPVQRLIKLNSLAYDFYHEKGIDLAKQMLEIGLCAQHNNGGLAIDCWWQSSVEGIFPVGECAASHGVYRPGGSALNAGQCGSARAARFIASQASKARILGLDGLEAQVDHMISLQANALNGTINLEGVYHKVRLMMSLYGGPIRSRPMLEKTLSSIREAYQKFDDVYSGSISQVWKLFELRNALITQIVYLEAMIDYINHNGASRGSALYTDGKGLIHSEGLDERFTYSLEDETEPSLIQEVQVERQNLIFTRREPRPIPKEDDFFENVWTRYRKDGCIW